MNYNFAEILKQFQLEGSMENIGPYGTGHINDTFAATMTCDNKSRRFILQRINHNIFKDPPALMENIARVTDHVRAKLEQNGVEQIDRKVLTVIKTQEGGSYYLDADGNYWRVYIFIEQAATCDVLTELNQAYQAAKAFGEFQGYLADLPAPPLVETIPDFHNGAKRYETFLEVLKEDPCNRAAIAKDEIEFLKKNADIFDVLPDLVKAGRIPVRCTHNDTKINNVMLDDETSEGICVIDLDTVMPGLALYDFGDIIRTTVSPVGEDEVDLSKVEMQIDRFDAILRGYLEGAGGFLNEVEKKHLVFCGKMITLIIGTRFLTDYLAGDHYFKVHRDQHNLQRCRAQFKLVQSIMDNEDEMNALLEKYCQR